MMLGSNAVKGLRSLELWSEFWVQQSWLWITKSWMLLTAEVWMLTLRTRFRSRNICGLGDCSEGYRSTCLPKLPRGLIQNLNRPAVCHREMGSCHQPGKQFLMKFNFGCYNPQCFAPKVQQLPRAIQPLSWSVLFLPWSWFGWWHAGQIF